MDGSKVAYLIGNVFFGDYGAVGTFCFWEEGGCIGVFSFGGDFGGDCGGV